jgi:hypothetical protein
MKGISTEKLTIDSEIVIEGEVEKVKSHWSKDRRTIVTKATVRNRDVIKGKSVKAKITIEYEGGEIDGLGLKVSDVAPLERGEKVILFLKKGKSKTDGSVYKIVGNAQGKYTIGDDGIARKKGFSLADDYDVIDNNIPVETLKKKIKRIK